MKAQLHRRESDQVQAMQGEFSAERERLKGQADEAERAHAKSKTKMRAAETKLLSSAQEANEARRERDVTLGELVTARLNSEGETVRANAAESKAANADTEVRILKAKLRRMRKMVETRDGKINDFKATTASDEAEQAAAKATEVSEERLATIRRVAGRCGERPVINRSNEEIGELEYMTARQCSSRMTARMLSATGKCSRDGAISEEALMDGLVEGGWLQTVWESKQMWELLMEWARELKDVLRLTWTPTLTSNIRDKLCVSYDKLDELRFSLSHYRVGKQLRPRPWVINTWTGDRENYPQPIAPRSGAGGWARLVKIMQQKWGLRMDETGRVAQRSFTNTVSAQVGRDMGRGLLRPLTYADPLVVVLGADGTGVGQRSITHVATSIAPSYKEGVVAATHHLTHPPHLTSPHIASPSLLTSPHLTSVINSPTLFTSHHR